MSRIAYVNGRYVPHGDAVVHIEDRGFQLADGVYEVWAVMGGKLADADGHFARLERSLGELRIAQPMGRAALNFVLRETIRRNHVRNGLVYLQVTRGTAKRDHAFPDPEVPPTLVVTAKSTDRAAAEAKADKGIAVITTPEIRWGRCDIKTVGLLPNALAKQAAKEKGAGEAWFVDADGLVTEGAASNAWIVDKDGVLRTRELTANILRGVTRASLLSVIKQSNIKFEERPFSVDDVKQAREAFITGAGALVLPVVAIDGQPIGDGKAGRIALQLRADYIAAAKAGVA
jgi:D-alanine transaminase